MNSNNNLRIFWQKSQQNQNKRCVAPLVRIGSKHPIIRIQVHNTRNWLAMADTSGTVHLVDTDCRTIARAIRLHSCVTCLSFNDFGRNGSDSCDLIVATVDKKTIHCLNICEESLSTRLLASVESAHKTCVHWISVSEDGMRAMTSSKYDTSLVWDLSSMRVIRQLVDSASTQSLFWAHDLIVTCYPRVVHVLDAHTFQVLESLEEQHILGFTGTAPNRKCSFVTRNEEKNSLQMYSTNGSDKRLDTKSISFAEKEIKLVKRIQAIKDNFLLLFLTTDGRLGLKNIITSEEVDVKCNRFSRFATNNHLLATITYKSDIIVFDLSQLSLETTRRIKTLEELEQLEAKSTDLRRKRVQNFCQILLKKYKRFPKRFRLFLWTQLLQIPRNTEAFARIARESQNMSPELLARLDTSADGLLNASLGRSLTALLRQLAYSRPELCLSTQHSSRASQQSLKLFCFPFIKILAKSPQILAFEIVTTLLDNNFFVSHDSPQEERICSLVADLLQRESLRLSAHLRSLEVSSRDYCRPLLCSLFSEVFLSNDWLKLCDNLLLFGPQMFVYICVAFSCLSKQLLFRLKSREEIQIYFRSQNSMPVNEVIELSHKFSQNYVQLIPYDFLPLTRHLYH